MNRKTYLKYEKRRYARNVVRRKREGDPAIFDYNGKNPILILSRKFAKWIKYQSIMHDDGLYISNLAVVTSFSCNMNCYGCGQHEPLIKKLPQEKLRVDMEQVKKDLKKISDAVDGIGGYALANGEGFINSGLEETIECFAKDKKVWNMNVPTNGTIVPSDELCKKMAKNGVSATITAYDHIPEEQREKVRKKFDEYGITHTTFYSRKWYLHEYLKEEICDAKEASEKHYKCERFFMLLQGRLYKCVTNATAIFAGVRPEEMAESIVIKNSSVGEIREFVENMTSVNYIEACKHCRGSVGANVIEIKAGEQIDG